MTCYHRLGAQGTRFVVRGKARSASGILEDIDISDATGLYIDFRRPNGTTLQVRAEKDPQSNDIFWVDETGILTMTGTWTMAASVRYGANDYVRAASYDIFEVIE